MSLTKDQAERICEEARFQGWETEPDEFDVREGRVEMYQVHDNGGWDRSKASDHHDWAPVPDSRLEDRPDLVGKGECQVCGISKTTGNEDRSCPGAWVEPKPLGRYWVTLRWAGWTNPQYHITETDHWRKLKAKVDELKQILQEIAERGWDVRRTGLGLLDLENRGPVRVEKSGKFGMMIEVIPPGGDSVYPIRVGGMRTWRKVCREFDNVIDIAPEAPAVEAPESQRGLPGPRS